MDNSIKIFNFRIFDRAGFSIVESIIVVAIFSIMMLTISLFFSNLYKQHSVDVSRIEGVGIAGRAIENMSSEMRKMNRAESGTFFIESAQDQILIFYSDIDNDDATEKIKYYLDGTDLKRDAIEPGAGLDYSGLPVTTIVASFVKNGTDPIFRYYDENYTGTQSALSSPANVTSVKVIEISIYINTKNLDSQRTVYAETKISPRNLKNFN